MAEPTRDYTSRPIDPDPSVRPPIRPVDERYDDDHRRRYVDDIAVQIPEAANLARDRVRWGPIIAGFVTALTSLVLLGMLGVAIGVTSMNAGFDAARGAPPPDIGRNASLWAGISTIIAFLIGGFVAGRTSAVFGRGWGALNGMLVFLFAVPFTLWLAGQGLGAIMGTVGNFTSGLTSGLAANPGAAANIAGQVAQSTPPSVNVTPDQVARAAETARNGAWIGLIGSLIALGMAALGGALGTRRVVEYERTTGAIHD